MLTRVETPQLPLLHRGKVRDSFRVDDRRRLLVVTDRISAFDVKLKTPIARKGEVLNRLAAFWFERTKHIVDNHVLSLVDAQAMLVRETVPVKIEMVVRGHIAGTMWRAYRGGRRLFCGQTLPEGLTENAKLPVPIVTPTTKEDSDREIDREGLIKEGLATPELFDELSRISLALFAEGQKLADQKGLFLADTKYEFGLVDGQPILIDEIHTADSSRFWDQEAFARDPVGVASFDKEFVRKFLREQAKNGVIPTELPADVAIETSRRYVALYERLTGEKLPPAAPDAKDRLRSNLQAAGLIRDAYVAIIMGSRGDLEFAKKIGAVVESYGVAVDLRVLSAHKTGESVAAALPEYNGSIEPGAIVAVAGESNGLGGALAASTNLPVVSCPPLKDGADFLVNINSSLRMPSKVPAATVIGPELAALAALRALNLRRLRERFDAEIAQMKAKLDQDDREVRAAARGAGRAS